MCEPISRAAKVRLQTLFPLELQAPADFLGDAPTPHFFLAAPLDRSRAARGTGRIESHQFEFRPPDPRKVAPPCNLTRVFSFLGYEKV